MQHGGTVTAFKGERRVATGSWDEVVRLLRDAGTQGADGAVLVFDDETGAQVDLDFRAAAPEPPTSAGGEEDVAARRAGRPKLGVVPREVTLLPRHWEWLANQPGGASVTLRKLVEAARKVDGEETAGRRAREAADRFMGAMLGNAPHYEDASRALYRGERSRFTELTEDWPADPRDHARRLAAPAFSDRAETERP
ncbi:hypothetical protein GCM10007036_43360 [Alsobacter metallidurans]|uniref:DUF2239 domain-containing protein n=1 Tax=Alsobacter metallidurans TaxID=340221 RepID=A0A917IAW1_9HYPH|nr:DUF2239 family protein [Alsobacter metallidurans]GGH31881.1 hypothetical protein GCM10007036_43360 [Alsobacter metallidurans]